MFYLCLKIVQAKKSAYIVAIGVYAVDTLILLYCHEFMWFIIHCYLLWCLNYGYKCAKEMINMDETLEKLDELLNGESEENDPSATVVEQGQ